MSMHKLDNAAGNSLHMHNSVYCMHKWMDEQNEKYKTIYRPTAKQ